MVLSGFSDVDGDELSVTNLSSSVGRVVYGSVEQATLALDAVAEELASLEAELQGLQFILTLEQDGLGGLRVRLLIRPRHVTQCRRS